MGALPPGSVPLAQRLLPRKKIDTPMKIDPPLKRFLAVAAASMLGLFLWKLSRSPNPDEAAPPPKSISAKPTVPKGQPAAPPRVGLSPEPVAVKSPKSMADAAYRACVITNQARREEALLALVEEMTAANAAAFLEELMRGNRTPDKPGQSVWNAFWRKWGSVDGKACLNELISRGQKNRIGSDAVLAMEGWAAADPQGAKEWLKTEQAELPIWNAAWATYQIQTHGNDLVAATPEILKLADSPAKMDAVARQLADAAQLQKGAEGLLEWFAAVPEDARKGAVNHFIYRLISSDPQAAVNFLTQNAQAPWRDDRHVGKLVAEISKQDPAGTAAWATSLHPSPADTPQDQTPVFVAARRWAEKDPVAAKAWLDANSQSPWAENARAGYEKGAPAIEADF